MKFNFELDVFNFQPVSGHSVHLVRDAKVFFSRSEFNHHHYSSPENFVSTNFFLSKAEKLPAVFFFANLFDGTAFLTGR